ncbi:MAG: hypothetical protein Q7S75_02125 [bacterium]|nr:hypothetical protein [bacterium]
MANVLPNETTKFVWEGYRGRLILVGSLVFLGMAILAGIALLPAYVVLQVEKSSQAKLAAIVSTQPEPNPQIQTERDDIIRTQTLIAKITPIVSATSSPTESIKYALALRPKGVTVTNINFTSGPQWSVTITGDSAGREHINQYREALSNDGHFQSVSVPVGALVGSNDGRFTITLTGTF